MQKSRTSIFDTIKSKLGAGSSSRKQNTDGGTQVKDQAADHGKGSDAENYWNKRMWGGTTGDESQKKPPQGTGSWTDAPSGRDISFIDPGAVEYFVKSAIMSGRMLKGTETGVEDTLERFGMMGQDGTITVAAALLFGKPNDVVDGSGIKIGEFSATGELLREELIDLPLIMQPDAVMMALVERYTPNTFEYVGARRNTVNPYPCTAIREAVVNAIVHKQYSYGEPILIKVNANYIEIYNPGELPERWVAEDLVRKHHSVRRNRRIAEVFYEAGFSESWGKGIGMMCEACKANGNPPPEFMVRHGGLEVVFGVRSAEYVDDESQSDLDSPEEELSDVSSYGASDCASLLFANLNLSVSEAVICRVIVKNPRITASEMSHLSGLSERQIYRITKSLTERGIIRREGSRKNGSWKFIDRVSL